MMAACCIFSVDEGGFACILGSEKRCSLVFNEGELLVRGHFLWIS